MRGGRGGGEREAERKERRKTEREMVPSLRCSLWLDRPLILIYWIKEIFVCFVWRQRDGAF